MGGDLGVGGGLGVGGWPQGLSRDHNTWQHDLMHEEDKCLEEEEEEECHLYAGCHADGQKDGRSHRQLAG